MLDAEQRPAETDASRRWLLAAGGASMLIALAGCQSGLSLDDSEGNSRSAEEILAEIRRQNGLSILSPDAKLERAAREQAAYMAASGRMEHRTGRGRARCRPPRDLPAEGRIEEVCHAPVRPHPHG